MIKKVITAALAAVTLTLSAVPCTQAAEQTEKTYTHVANVTHKPGSMVIYSYNVPYNTKGFINFTNNKTNEEFTATLSKSMGNPIGYGFAEDDAFITKTGTKVKSDTCSSSAPSVNLSGAEGTYEKIRIKLSDFSTYFNADGSHTMKVSEHGDHKFIFREENADSHGCIFSSELFIYSGSAINHVVPDKNGEVEIYVHKKLGDKIMFSTEYNSLIYYTGSNGVKYEASVTGGGTSGSYLRGLKIGDADADGGLYISDSTVIQKYLSHRITLNKLQMRNADANCDGKVDIEDATLIQKYLVVS